jgi:hypothetical protein
MAAIQPPNPAAPPEIVEAYDFEHPDRPIRVDLNTLTRYVLHLRGFDADAIMPSIRHPRWPNQEFFLTCVLGSPDGRWFVQGGPAPSREEWQSLVRRSPSSALKTLARVPPDQAAEILFRAGCEPLPNFDEAVQASATGGNPTQTVDPLVEDLVGAVRARPSATPSPKEDQAAAGPGATPRGDAETTGSASTGAAVSDSAAPKPKRTRKARRVKKPPRPSTLKELAAAIRRDSPRQKRVPRFLDLIADNDDVSFHDIEDKVHEAVVEDCTIEKTIVKARKAIIDARLPFTLVVSDRRVSKKPIP